VGGEIVYFRAEPLEPKDTEAVVRIVMAQRFGVTVSAAALRDMDVSYEVPELGRFRVSVYMQRGSLSLVMRVVARTCPTLDALKLPKAVRALADRERGLLLVVGHAGHGKSSTVAAMIAHIVETHAKHVVTIEDPIEFVHEEGRSSVSQREVGVDTESFARGVRACSRHDANVLMVGDVRDAAALDAMLDAAETGLLVVSTMNAPDVERTVERLVSMSANGQQTRERLGECLQGIVAQRLLPRLDGSGRVLATEVLVGTSAVRGALRRAEQGGSLRELMERGSSYGMHTLAMDVERLVKEGVIDGEVARHALTTL